MVFDHANIHIQNGWIVQLTKLRAEEFYDEHKKADYYDSMVQYMMRYRPSFTGLVLETNPTAS